MGAVAHISALSNADAIGASDAVIGIGASNSVPINQISQEARDRLLWRRPGTVSALTVHPHTNTDTGTGTIRFRKNNANGNGIISIPAGGTGHYQDLVNTDTVASGDYIAASGVRGGGAGSFTLGSISFAFAATSGANVARLVCQCPKTLTAATNLFSLAGARSDPGTETIVQTSLPSDGTLENGAVHITNSNRSAGSTVTLRIDGANTAISISVPAATAGWFEDVVNTATVTAAQRGAWDFAVGVGTGDVDLLKFAVDYVLDGHTAVFATSDANGNILQGQTRYAPICGGAQLATSEAAAQCHAITAHALANLTVNIQTNTLSAAQTCRVRIDGAPGNQVVSVGAGVTGWLSDAVNTDDVDVGALLNYEIAAGAGTGGSLWEFMGMGAVEAPAAPEPTVETLSATNVRSTSATLRGRIDPNGTPFFGRFAWWICAESPPTVTETEPQSVGAGSTPVVFTFNLTGLLPDTTYCYQALGNDGGSPADDTEGVIRSFRTSGEAEFIDGTVSHPLTWIEMYHGDGDDKAFAEVDLNDRAGYYIGYKVPWRWRWPWRRDV